LLLSRFSLDRCDHLPLKGAAQQVRFIREIPSGCQELFSNKVPLGCEPKGHFFNKFRRRPTFPHSFPCSIISAVGLNFCVRDGNRCDPYAIATEKLKSLKFSDNCCRQIRAMLLWQSLFDRFLEVGGRRTSPLPH
jgi:hypothetical protein